MKVKLKKKYNYSQHNKCQICKNIISNNAKLCKKCANEKHSNRMRGMGNSNYRNGTVCNNRCINCDKKILKYHLRCWDCYVKWSKNPKNNPMYGKHRTKEEKEKIRKGRLGKYSGKNNPNYKHGRGNEPYPSDFNYKLKIIIRKRDNYTCQNCDMTEEEHLIVVGRILDVHHIDYNKENINKNNLITTCQKCNSRANGNRNYWFAYFTYINIERKENKSKIK